MESSRTEDIFYLTTLNRMKGVGLQSILRIIKIFPTPQELLRTPVNELEQKLGHPLSQCLSKGLTEWSTLWAQAQENWKKSVEKGIVAIPITSDYYPPLLQLIADPPPILYAKGNISLLKDAHTVAIVGTREPTQRGLDVAHYLAQQWAEYKYIIVSGLAKGIDTAAHEGALSVQGRTVAVLGTSLDKIYPAENRGLVERILKQNGLLLSEISVGQPSFKTAFVRRDRIQSGLSLCVMPVQTRKDGGTMHTIHFAKEQKRYVACPQPATTEKLAIQYEGIWSLISEQKIPCFNIEREKNYKILNNEFELLLQKLLLSSSIRENDIEEDKEHWPSDQENVPSLWSMVEQRALVD